MRFAFAAALLLATVAGAQTSQPSWQAVDGGELILRPFPHAPYPHASRENGWKYQDKVFAKADHYDDSTVGIYIPRGFTPGEKVDYIVHFHGWGNHVSNVLTQFDLPKQLNHSGANAILIVPQGPKDASDSGGGKLELDPGAFEQLMTEITQYLQAEHKITTDQIGHITLSAHSGGYKVTAAILDHGGLADHLTDVLLLDASYGSLEWFVNWAKASPTHRLVSTYTDHLEKTNQELIGLMKTAGVQPHLLDETTLADADLRQRGPIFFHTVGPHNQVPIAYFARFLAGADLSRLSTTQSLK